MKAYRVTTGILFGLMAVLRADEVAPQETLPSAPVGFTWQAKPELSDEFNAQQLDATKWLPYQPYWQGREPSHFEPKNVVLGKGMLRLRSTTLVTNLAEVKNPGTDVWVHSACVSSKQPVAFYGYYEARIKTSRLRNAIYTKHLHDQLQVEQAKSEQLLLNILPKAIAERMKQGETNLADSHPDVTVLVADLVGFTTLSAHIGPEQVVQLLNEIFSAFDLLTEKHGLEKIKTIGDAYMVPGGEIYPAARSAKKRLLKNSPEERAANGRWTRQPRFQEKRAMPKTPI